MKLLTHNLLQCHVKNCTRDNFPLELREYEIDTREAEFNPEFLARFFNKLDWPTVLQVSKQLELPALPETVEDDMLNDEGFLKMVHNVLFETVVVNGKMVCRGCGHIYEIKDEIPNMLLLEDEV